MQRTLAFLLLMSAPAWAVQAAASPGAVSQQEQNEAIARRVFDEILNQGKFQAADEIYARDFVNHGLHRDANLAEDQAAVRRERTACPDLHVTVDLMTASQDTVTVVWTARGRNTRRSGWLPATGARIEVRGITVWRIVDGRIREEWTTFDQMRIAREVAQQLWWLEIGLVVALLLLDWGLSRLVGRMWGIVRQPQPPAGSG
ncbi:MAG TPA: ester cyclase [Acidobacteriaceae bacterium]|nr:ester cyclase [Acidobacteriaceae bacterium]